MKLIGIVGHINSGKDTVAERLRTAHGYKKVSFAGPLKDMISTVFGWDRALLEGDTKESRNFRETPDLFWSQRLGIPNFTPRYAMQYLGTDIIRNHFNKDVWVSSIEYRLFINNGEHNTVISDARFLNELEMIRSHNGKIIWVRRGGLPEWFETAMLANQGFPVAKKIMETQYKNVHPSEWEWAGFPVDHIIYNNGTLEDLYKTVDNIISE